MFKNIFHVMFLKKGEIFLMNLTNIYYAFIIANVGFHATYITILNFHFLTNVM